MACFCPSCQGIREAAGVEFTSVALANNLTEEQRADPRLCKVCGVNRTPTADHRWCNTCCLDSLTTCQICGEYEHLLSYSLYHTCAACTMREHGMQARVSTIVKLYALQTALIDTPARASLLNTMDRLENQGMDLTREERNLLRDSYLRCSACSVRHDPEDLVVAWDKYRTRDIRGRVITITKKHFSCTDCVHRQASGLCEQCNIYVTVLINNAYCRPCHEAAARRRRTCENCREAYDVDEMHSERRCTRCVGLKDYRWRPDEFIVQKLPEEGAAIGIPTLGFELEMEAQDDENFPRNKITEKVSNYDWLYCKFDGSLNRRTGLEIVSMPFTYDWWKNIGESKFIDILNYLRSNGVRSYQTEERCGIHVHISKDCFDHIRMHKFLQMIYDYSGLALKIGQRPRSSRGIARYARLDDPDAANLPAKAREFRNINNPEHYCAVNLGIRTTHPTAEVRIYRGTMNPPSFCKNIEHVHALWNFCDKNNGASHVGEKFFLDWLDVNRTSYPNLFEFLKTKNLI